MVLVLANATFLSPMPFFICSRCRMSGRLRPVISHVPFHGQNVYFYHKSTFVAPLGQGAVLSELKVQTLFALGHLHIGHVGIRFVLGTAPSHVSIPPNQNGTMAEGK